MDTANQQIDFPGELRHDEEAWWDAARLRVAERRYEKALNKFNNGLGTKPMRPDRQQYHRKYGNMREWDDLCANLHKPSPLSRLPELAQERVEDHSTASATGAGLDEKAAVVEVSTTP